jgi:GR25 family glycosyltransferase involved in LPS biosynthesis
MKAFVITIHHNPNSVEAAERCIESGKKYGILVEKWSANAPDRMDIHEWFRERSIPDKWFHEEYSRLENCMAAFSSHYTLWQHCVKLKQPILILEHDAVFVDRLPVVTQGHIVNFGKPSYGDWLIPNFVGENKIFSKAYLPGAHAYKVTPAAAQELIARAAFEAGPTDVYIHRERFHFINEVYPWPVEVQETFTTIQRTMGCYAKHQYNDKYKII